MLEAMISLETFHFVEWHYAELANVPGFTSFLVSCANMALPSRILLRATSTLHNFLNGVFLKITKKLPRVVHMRPIWGRRVPVTLCLGLALFLSPPSYL
jgi:hypothetical protein